jgi:hypothetical protein
VKVKSPLALEQSHILGNQQLLSSDRSYLHWNSASPHFVQVLSCTAQLRTSIDDQQQQQQQQQGSRLEPVVHTCTCGMSYLH